MLKHVIIVLFIYFLCFISNILTNYVNNHFSSYPIILVCFAIISSLYSFCIWFWNNYLWKIFSNILNIPPNINGEYNIEIESSYDNKIYKGNSVIKQTYEAIVVETTFEKSKSISTIATLQKTQSGWCLLYSYQNTARDRKLQKDGGSHKGFSELKITKDKNKGYKGYKIEGEYANYERNTRGNITFYKKEYIYNKTTY